jgi:hypothetical protein
MRLASIQHGSPEQTAASDAVLAICDTTATGLLERGTVRLSWVSIFGKGKRGKKRTGWFLVYLQHIRNFLLAAGLLFRGGGVVCI